MLMHVPKGNLSRTKIKKKHELIKINLSIGSLTIVDIFIKLLIIYLKIRNTILVGTS